MARSRRTREPPAPDKTVEILNQHLETARQSYSGWLDGWINVAWAVAPLVKEAFAEPLKFRDWRRGMMPDPTGRGARLPAIETQCVMLAAMDADGNTEGLDQSTAIRWGLIAGLIARHDDFQNIDSADEALEKIKGLGGMVEAGKVYRLVFPELTVLSDGTLVPREGKAAATARRKEAAAEKKRQEEESKAAQEAAEREAVAKAHQEEEQRREAAKEAALRAAASGELPPPPPEEEPIVEPPEEAEPIMAGDPEMERIAQAHRDAEAGEPTTPQIIMPRGEVERPAEGGEEGAEVEQPGEAGEGEVEGEDEGEPETPHQSLSEIQSVVLSLPEDSGHWSVARKIRQLVEREGIRPIDPTAKPPLAASLLLQVLDEDNVPQCYRIVDFDILTRSIVALIDEHRVTHRLSEAAD